MNTAGGKVLMVRLNKETKLLEFFLIDSYAQLKHVKYPTFSLNIKEAVTLLHVLNEKIQIWLKKERNAQNVLEYFSLILNKKRK